MEAIATVEGRVIWMIQRQRCLATPPPLTARLVADLGCDSLDLYEIVMYCEDEFCIQIDDESAQKCILVADVIALVNNSHPS